MPRCSKRNNRRKPSCNCLVDAFRTFQARTEPVLGCGAPECPVKSLDSLTLQRFLQAIGGSDAQGIEGSGREGAEEQLPLFRAVARRRNR